MIPTAASGLGGCSQTGVPPLKHTPRRLSLITRKLAQKGASLYRAQREVFVVNSLRFFETAPRHDDGSHASCVLHNVREQGPA